MGTITSGFGSGDGRTGMFVRFSLYGVFGWA